MALFCPAAHPSPKGERASDAKIPQGIFASEALSPFGEGCAAGQNRAMGQSAEFGQFLRVMRARMSPEAAGLPTTSTARRVRGLRREEVAQLAGVSTDYYTRLEQGRQIRPSRAVVDAVARALQLDATERAHMLDLLHN